MNKIKKAFEDEGINIDNSEVQDFMTFYKMWRGMRGKN
jgi:hypothetical protein